MLNTLKKYIKCKILSILRSLKAYRSYANMPEGETNLNELTDITVLDLTEYPAFKRSTPITADKNINNNFMLLIHDQPQKTFTIKAPNWRVWGNRGAVITSGNKLFKDVSREFTKKTHSVLEQFKLIPPQLVTGNTAVLAAPGAEMYYHWMFDVLPRIELLQNSYPLNDIDQFVLNYHDLPFQTETFEILGITNDRLLRANNTWDFHILADNLIIPSLPSKLDIASARACIYLRSIFLDETISYTGNKKIYLKRTEKRKIINEEQIEEYLNSKGFVTIYCEQYSVREQALIFNYADVIIGPHGAAFTNVVFCKPGTTVIEFFSPKWINPCYWTVCNEVNLNYYYLTGEGKGDTIDIGADMTVNLEKLKKLTDVTGVI